MSQFLAFKRYHTAEQAAEIISLLEKHQIPVEYEEEVILMDKMYSGQNFDQRHLVKIASTDFPKADALLKSQISVSADDVEPDYYLLSFTTEELKEVVIKKDEWGDYDYLLALKLLEKRGISYTPEQLEQLGTTRIEALSQPQELPLIWLLIGYGSPLLIFTSLFLPFAWAFSFLGFFIGGFVMVTKKTLPDGKRVHAFTERTRKLGMWMIVSCVVLTVACWTVLVKGLG